LFAQNLSFATVAGGLETLDFMDRRNVSALKKEADINLFHKGIAIQLDSAVTLHRGCCDL
jgi:hypothetical protein